MQHINVKIMKIKPHGASQSLWALGKYPLFPLPPPFQWAWVCKIKVTTNFTRNVGFIGFLTGDTNLTKERSFSTTLCLL